MAQKQKSRTTKSPLMQDWVFRLGPEIFFLFLYLYYHLFDFQRDRRQCLIFDGHKGMFPCKYLDKSYIKPKSVHKLRPGDIDIGVFHQL